MTATRGKVKEVLAGYALLAVLGAGYAAVLLAIGGVLVGMDYLLRQHVV